MWAAIRYRRAQALTLVLLSALITACAVFAPLYERALEQSLLRDGLTRQSAVTTALVASATQATESPPEPAVVRGTLPAALATAYGSGDELWSGRVDVTGVAGRSATVQVVGPQDTCAALEVTQGRCPTAAYEVLVSAAEAAVQGWTVGTRLEPTEVVSAGRQPTAFPRPFTVTGFYRQQGDPGHWQGFALEGRAGQVAAGVEDTPLMDGWVTPPSTFATGWSAARLDVVWLVRPDTLTLGNLAGIPAAVEEMRQTGLGKVPALTLRTGVSDLVTDVVAGQQQARTIVPLLVGQLAVLAVVVLGLVAAAAVEQRRPELALGRLRGLGPGGAGLLVVRELGVVVAAGVPLGFALALGLGEVARRFWLAPGVPFELPPATFVAAGISLVVGVLAVALVARPTLREPIATLLRRVPPRRAGWAVGVVDAVVVAVAAAGIVTLLNGNLSGPLALATPTLIALALGLVLAHVLIPAADALSRRFSASGNVTGGLTALQVARRPAVRRIMAIITVATALTVFATDALVAGARNRSDRAQVEVGAEAVLTTNATTVTALRDAVRAADPTGTRATPVVEVRQGSSSALTTLAVVPGEFARVAELPRDAAAFTFSALDVVGAPEVVLTGRALSVTVQDAALSLLDPSASASLPGWRTPPPPASLMAYLAPPGSAAIAVNLGAVPVGSAGPVTLERQVSCAEGCRLVGLGVAPSTDGSGITGSLSVGPVVIDGGAPTPLGDLALWQATDAAATSSSQSPPYAKPVDVGDRTRLGLSVRATTDPVRVTVRGSTAELPALVAGGRPTGAGGPGFQAAGLDGITTDFTEVAAVPYAPGGATEQAIVNLDALAARTTAIAPLALAQVWLSDAAAVPAVTASLARSGLAVRTVETRAERELLFDRSASAWGLRLALVVGLLALAVAALVLVLVAVTSWRVRSRDYAALRMAGVRAGTLRRVGLAEQWTVVVVSVVVGAVSGLVGAQLAMPIIPFFTTPSAVLPLDTSPALGPVALAVLAALVLLLAVGAVVGVRLVERASLARVRDQL